MRIINFSAGPAALPQAVLEQAQAEMLNWRGVGASVMEISHRDAEFIELADQAEADLRELMAIPAGYHVLFLQGGATQHFAQIPMNLATPEQSADYIITGAWGQKAAKEAATLMKVNVVADTASYTAAPDYAGLAFADDAAFVHLTPNETIHGVELFDLPKCKAPIVADMSSNILSRPINVADYGLIYAGAQKNIGPSGIVVMIVRNDLLKRQPRKLPAILNYAKHAENKSMLNTPPTFGLYMAGLVFKWLKAQGGLSAMQAKNEAKANALYDYIDGSGFYKNPVAKANRSCMNVPFVLPTADMDKAFLAGAKQAQMLGLKGHRDVGGMRASIYNATEQSAVDALISYMKDFAARA
jgi:phosphoserine aminotransferase